MRPCLDGPDLLLQLLDVNAVAAAIAADNLSKNGHAIAAAWSATRDARGHGWNPERITWHRVLRKAPWP